ncbi:hypothetical protein GCM10010377_48990 [Streptomyces viridiviolaceus]|nr:hypothetical protein GCM10010377_48990 [Streptomyces viridiviolaceus]
MYASTTGGNHGLEKGDPSPASGSMCHFWMPSGRSTGQPGSSSPSPTPTSASKINYDLNHRAMVVTDAVPCGAQSGCTTGEASFAGWVRHWAENKPWHEAA